MINILEKFIKQVNARSEENKKSFDLLYEQKCYGVCIGIIRQELDSLQRVNYLIDWERGYQLRHNAFDLVKNSVKLGEWKFLNSKGKMQNVKDWEMLAQGGWEEIAYDFGCGLIHLSNKHLYRDFDPVISMEKEEKEKIIGYLNFYHGFDKREINMNDIIEYLPKIYNKIYENIESLLEEIISINQKNKVFS